MRYETLILVAAFALAAGLRMLAPENLFQGDQEKQVGYVMDILHGGSLAMQYEVNGRIATKPPLYNWCAAVICAATGSTAPLVMKLPGLLAAAGVIGLTYLLTRRFFGPESAFWAALAFIAAHHFQKLMWFARTDMLLACTVLLAIQASLAMHSRWWRSAVVGLILGASFLTKGPVGPTLYVIWLVLWGWRRGALRDGRQWVALLPGLVVFAAIAWAWLGAVWQDPQFHQTVLHGEIGDRLSADSHRGRPFWYYVPLLLQRIAPWSVVALAGVVVARRRLDAWREVGFVGLWALAYFIFFSAVPAKRHDLLLPVYPPVLALAGLCLSYLAKSDSQFWGRCLAWPLAAAAVAGPLSVGFRAGISAAVLLAGAAALMCSITAVRMLARQRRLALTAAILGLAIYVGMEGWPPSDAERAYAQLKAFVNPLQAAAREGRVFVWQAHPLASYALGLHQRGLDVSALPVPQAGSAFWLIAGLDVPESVRQSYDRRMKEADRLVIKDEGVNLVLYRVSGTGRSD